MKKIIFLILIDSAIAAMSLSAQNYEWAKRIGGPGDQFSMDMATDSLGNVYLIGNLQGTNIDFDPGSGVVLLSSAGGTDIFFAKYDSSGNYLWAKSIGGTGDDVGARIAVDNSGNVYITGWFQSTNVDFDPGPENNMLSTTGLTDIYFGKYDTEGNHLWAYSIGSSYYEGGHDIAIDNAGHIYITGYFGGTDVDFDPGPGTAFLSSQANSGDIFIAKYHDDGTYSWAVKCSGPAYEVGNGIAADETGNVCITGGFKGSVDFDPGNGTELLGSAGGYDIFFAKYDSLGNYLWAHGAGSTGDDIGADIVSDGAGNCIISARFKGNNVDFDPGSGNSFLTSNGGFDIATAKYDTGGNYIWARQTGGQQDDYGVKIIIDAEGSIYHTGSFKGTNVDFDPGPGTAYLDSKGSDDIFFTRYDTDGNYVWAESIGGLYSDFGNSIALSGPAKVSITGGFMGTGVDFDPGAGTAFLNSAGGVDIFYARYSQDVSGIENPGIETGQNIILDQNYPNPAFNKAAIGFSLVTETHITLKISNLFGKEMKILMNEVKKPGRYFVETDVRDLVAGIYFYSVNSDDEMITRKMMVVK
jgi:hypothetical protein